LATARQQRPTAVTTVAVAPIPVAWLLVYALIGKEVLDEWEKQAAMKLGGHVEPDGMRIAGGRDLAVTHNYEKGANVNTGGMPGSVSIRATNLFRKESGTWKMIGHHTDKLSFLSREDAPSSH
jgi:SnoaL-like domain